MVTSFQLYDLALSLFTLLSHLGNKQPDVKIWSHLKCQWYKLKYPWKMSSSMCDTVFYIKVVSLLWEYDIESILLFHWWHLANYSLSRAFMTIYNDRYNDICVMVAFCLYVLICFVMKTLIHLVTLLHSPLSHL